MTRYKKLQNFAYSKIFKNNYTLCAAAMVLSATLATVIFVKINFEPYYATRGSEYKKEAKSVFDFIGVIVNSKAVSKGEKEHVLQDIKMIINNTKACVEVIVDNKYRIKNGKCDDIDYSRAIIYERCVYENNIGKFDIKYIKSNRPDMIIHLVRAWTFSLQDYIHDKNGYYEHQLYLRSKYLYIAFITVFIFISTLLIIIKKVIEEQIMMKEQLEKEGYFLLRKKEALLKERENLRDMQKQNIGSQQVLRQLNTIDTKINEIDAEIGKISQKSGTNVAQATLVYLDAGQLLTANEIRDILLISKFLEGHIIDCVKYSDRYFRKTEHIETFRSIIKGNWLSKDKTTVNINVVLVDKGETKEKKQTKLENRLIDAIVDIKSIDVDVATINKREFLHMRKLELVRDDNKSMELIFDMGMDFVEPYQDKYLVASNNYVVIQSCM